MTELELPEGITVFETPLPGIKVDTPAAQGAIYTNGAHVADGWMATRSTLSALA